MNIEFIGNNTNYSQFTNEKMTKNNSWSEDECAAVRVCLKAFSSFGLQFFSNIEAVRLAYDILTGDYEGQDFFVSQDRVVKFSKADKVYVYNEKSQKIGSIKLKDDELTFSIGEQAEQCKTIKNRTETSLHRHLEGKSHCTSTTKSCQRVFLENFKQCRKDN